MGGGGLPKHHPWFYAICQTLGPSTFADNVSNPVDPKHAKALVASGFGALRTSDHINTHTACGWVGFVVCLRP